MHHDLITILCENISEADDLDSWMQEDEMRKTRKLVEIVRGDRQLLGMFSGIVLDITVLVAILVTACVWYLP